MHFARETFLNIFETRFSFFINADFYYQVIVLSLFKSPEKKPIENIRLSA